MSRSFEGPTADHAWQQLAEAFRAGDGVLVPAISLAFRNYNGTDICDTGRYHTSIFPQGRVSDFVARLRSLTPDGYLGRSGDRVKTS